MFSRFKKHIDHKHKQNSSRARTNELCKRSILIKIWSWGPPPEIPGKGLPTPF